jgi:hemerythrin-like domain-containing protein
MKQPTTHPVMQRLHDDHRNFRLILDLLRSEVDQLDGVAEGRRNLSLIADIMQYMVHYADRFHHPLEDQIYGLLARHDRSDSIATLERQHVALEKAGQDLQQRAHLDISAEHGWTHYAAELREYSETLMRHKDLEEITVFPLAKVLLDSRDFDGIQSRFAWLDDPVFGGGLAEGYKVLGECLLRKCRSS